MTQQSQLLEVAHGVPDGGRGDAEVVRRADVLRADRLGARDVALHHEFEDAALPRVQFESGHSGDSAVSTIVLRVPTRES